MTISGNQSQESRTTEQRLIKVAVRINPETIDELRAMYADQEQKVSIRMVKIGGWRYPCAIYLLPEDEAKGFMRLQQNEAKQEQREARCWFADGSGGYIRCPEENKCSECERCKSFRFDSNHSTSYEALQDFYAEQEEELYLAGEEITGTKDPSAEAVEPQQEEAYTEIMQILVDRLSAIKPKYGAIFQELLKGNLQPLNIAKALGLGKSQVYETVPKVQEIAKKLYFELQDK